MTEHDGNQFRVVDGNLIPERDGSFAPNGGRSRSPCYSPDRRLANSNRPMAEPAAEV